jgi:hypothetical protein
MRQYLPMLREEYRPVSVFINSFKSRSQQNLKRMSREELDSLEVEILLQNYRKKLSKRTVDRKANLCLKKMQKL